MGVERTERLEFEVEMKEKDEEKSWKLPCVTCSLELSDFAAFLRLQEGADLHRGVARGFLFDEERNQDNKNKR